MLLRNIMSLYISVEISVGLNSIPCTLFLVYEYDIAFIVFKKLIPEVSA